MFWLSLVCVHFLFTPFTYTIRKTGQPLGLYSPSNTELPRQRTPLDAPLTGRSPPSPATAPCPSQTCSVNCNHEQAAGPKSSGQQNLNSLVGVAHPRHQPPSLGGPLLLLLLLGARHVLPLAPAGPQLLALALRHLQQNGVRHQSWGDGGSGLLPLGGHSCLRWPAAICRVDLEQQAWGHCRSGWAAVMSEGGRSCAWCSTATVTKLI